MYSFPLKGLWAFLNEVSIYSCLIESFICVSIFCLNLVNFPLKFTLGFRVQFSFSRESAECLFEGEGGRESPKNLDNVKTAAAVFELETKEFIHLEGKYSLR